MAGINPATGQFDPYYVSPTNYYTGAGDTYQLPNGTFVNPTWTISGPDGGAPVVSPTTPTVSPTTSDTDTGDETPQWVKDMMAQQAAALERQRTSAFDTLTSMFKSWGIDLDGTGLAAQVKSWVWEDKSPDAIVMEFRKSDAYNKRFTGMADLIKRGQFMNEAEYIAQERAYRGVMVAWGLPENFYDGYDDYGRFIANGVSVKELEDRIVSAKTFLDSTDPTYRNTLRDLYGITEGGMLAYVLDGDKAQSILNQQMKAAAFAGSAANYDFGLSKDQAEKYGATLGDQFNRIGADQINALGSQMAALDEVADNQESLAFIDNEAFTRTDTLDAEILNDTTKRSASQRRALREKARFSGASAFGRGSFARSSGA